MPTKNAGRGASEKTRGLILGAAVLRFSRHSYEEATLRDIAADVGVDVALVHRAFGSKERLFAEALRSVFQPGEWLERVDAEILPHLIGSALGERGGRQEVRQSAPGPLDIVVRSLGSPQALPIVREFLFRDFIDPLAARLDGPKRQRAMTITACLAGIRLFREVLGMGPVFDEREQESRRLIAAVLVACLEPGDK
ncbi:MAG: TetR family transcriptional regulator [Aurantimonas endophytica]|uniref:TetR/AcrR family transcriptional regulator n=1 Tax=Aurantimonas endophytica TaxID=1522175 RepID=UPI003003439C